MPNAFVKNLQESQESVRNSSSTLIAFHKGLPLSMITKFAGIQAIVEHVAEASKVHFIVLDIKNGIHCIILMQAFLAQYEPPVKHLKVTALRIKQNPLIHETGKRLASFALSLDMKLSFNIVEVADFLDLHVGLFQLDSDEALVVYAPYVLAGLITQSDRLENLMRVIRTIRPRVVILAKVEANINSPNFVNRFVEAIVFYGAFFEALECCMKSKEEHRMQAESTCFRQAIRNIIASDGDQRKTRYVNINVWRKFLARFGMVEVELSMSSMYQANLVLENFTGGSSFTLDMDGNCLIIGWKGTPLSSLSVWKFHIDPQHES